MIEIIQVKPWEVKTLLCDTWGRSCFSTAFNQCEVRNTLYCIWRGACSIRYALIEKNNSDTCERKLKSTPQDECKNM